jgi:hypothetical protein
MSMRRRKANTSIVAQFVITYSGRTSAVTRRSFMAEKVLLFASSCKDLKTIPHSGI